MANNMFICLISLDLSVHATRAGPLCNGATTLMFESTPTYPNCGRYWDLVQKHKVSACVGEW